MSKIRAQTAFCYAIVFKEGYVTKPRGQERVAPMIGKPGGSNAAQSGKSRSNRRDTGRKTIDGRPIYEWKTNAPRAVASGDTAVPHSKKEPSFIEVSYEYSNNEIRPVNTVLDQMFSFSNPDESMQDYPGSQFHCSTREKESPWLAERTSKNNIVIGEYGDRALIMGGDSTNLELVDLDELEPGGYDVGKLTDQQQQIVDGVKRYDRILDTDEGDNGWKRFFIDTETKNYVVVSHAVRWVSPQQPPAINETAIFEGTMHEDSLGNVVWQEQGEIDPMFLLSNYFSGKYSDKDKS